MWGLLAWLVLLAATVVLASVAFHFDVAQAPEAFQALSPAQQIAAILIALVALALTASTLWQSWRLTREAQDARAAQGGMLGAKKGAALAAVSQKDFDAAVAIFRPAIPRMCCPPFTSSWRSPRRGWRCSAGATRPST